MTKIYTYEVFCKVKAVSESGFYCQIYPQTFKDAHRRLQFLQLTEPEKYTEWLTRWKSHDRN